MFFLFLTWLAWFYASTAAQQARTDYFDFRAREMVGQIKQRMQAYEQVLLGVKGLFTSSVSVERDEFRNYVSSLELTNTYPGIQGVGFSRYILATAKESHVVELRQQGFPEYSIYPKGEREVYSSIVYLEPFEGRNLRAFGYDMFSDPFRQAAMALARDTGVTAMSGKVRLVQETGHQEQAGFLIYLPVYRNGMPSSNVEERRANLLGWAYSPFRVDDLMRGIQRERASDLGIMIFDGDEATQASLMYDSSLSSSPSSSPSPGSSHRFNHQQMADSRFLSVHSVVTAGRTWTLHIRAQPGLFSQFEQNREKLIVAGGIVTSVLLTWLIWLLVTGRERAIVAANAMNRDLVESESRFRHFFENNSSVMLLIDPQNGEIVEANQAAVAFYGFPMDRLMGIKIDQINTMGLDEIAQERQLAAYEGRKYLFCSHRLASGETREVEVHATLTLVAGKERQLSIVHDITERKQAERSLAEFSRDFESFLEQSSDFIYFKDSESRFRFCSQTLAEITGHVSWRDMIGKHDLEVFPADTAKIYQDEEEVIFKEGKPLLNKIDPYYDAQGRLGYVQTNKWPLFDARGIVVGIFGVSRDITEQKRTQTRLQLAASVFSHAREGISITDAMGHILDVNESFTRITGYSREESVGENPRILKSGRQSSEFYSAMWQALAEKGYWSGEIWNRRKSGDVYPEMLTISAVRDADGQTQNYVALFSDITSMKEHADKLEHVAHYDALTGLPNRLLLADRLRQAMAQCQRRDRSLAVVYLDLDGFKAVNDEYGHSVGDELLISISLRMKNALRDGDTLARIGGDEFVAVLVDLEHLIDCQPVLGRLLQAAAEPVMAGKRLLQVSASIGVTLYPQDEADADLLLRHADQAMYLAKQAGKNRYHLFDVDEDAAMRSRGETLEHIRQALVRHEFVLYYQPKVNMKTGAVVGAEALIRWQHPERGLLLPAAFLAFIEDHPISVELGQWVLNTALSQMSAWHQEGLDIPVSVNISARQLQQTDFALRMADLLAAHPDVKPDCLELEILETSALEDMAQTSEVMHACRALGVHFALDDFGTGYSSLTYLKRLPVELLKIDKSFVLNMIDDVDDLAIVDGVVGLAGAFRRQVIAEGVETIAHGDLLLPLGCELAQGYGVARPMPAAEMLAWTTNWRPPASWSAWRNRPLNRNDPAMVFAEVKHRNWVRLLEAFLANGRGKPPPMDAHECHFGHWLATEGKALYAAQPAFTEMNELHQQVHAMGQARVKLHQQGFESSPAQRAEFDALCAKLIQSLRESILMDEST
jgi:diguanylate cyclase (GGDEF)-like protein/PAS domain S-box-containing protein